MKTGTLFSRLAVMMLLEYAVFGSWYATVGLVLTTAELSGIIGVTFSLGALGAIISPLLLGAIADRYFPSQRVLSLLHLAGGALLLMMPDLIAAGNGTAFLLVVFVYMLLFQPTVGLSNTIAFSHLGQKQWAFPYLRVFGTLGWVIVGLSVGGAGLSASTDVFVVAAVCSVTLGLYSLFLPATPPPQKGARFTWGDVVGAGVFRLLKRRNFVVFSICTLLTCVPIAMYNSYASTFLGAAGIGNVAGVLAIGQLSELVFISLLPFFLRVLGIKWVLVVGMITWAVRFGLFMLAAEGPLGPLTPSIIAVALHGICNDFFLIAGFMYVDRATPARNRAQGQSYFVFLNQGVGTFVGALIGGWVFNTIVTPSGPLTQWILLWAFPLVVAVVATGLLVTLFQPNSPGADGPPRLEDTLVQPRPS